MVAVSSGEDFLDRNHADVRLGELELSIKSWEPGEFLEIGSCSFHSWNRRQPAVFGQKGTLDTPRAGSPAVRGCRLTSVAEDGGASLLEGLVALERGAGQRHAGEASRFASFRIAKVVRIT